MQIGPFELKIELAHHLHHYAQGAQALRTRLEELRVSTKVLDAPVPVWLHNASSSLLQVGEPIAFVICFREILLRVVRGGLEEHLRATDQLLDDPTIRMLRPVMHDLEAADAWCTQVEAAALDAGDNSSDWTLILGTLTSKVGDWRANEAKGEALPRLQFKRDHACRRDDRMPVFHETRQYRSDDLKLERPQGDLERECVELFRVQRDELDAIETFANVIFDMRPSFELEMLLARLVSDEARHAELGQQNLHRMGFDPFSIPCGVIGINVRSPLPPLIALAQISIFGELNQVGTLRRLSDRCCAEDDSASGKAFDFTHADEVMHLRQVRRWLPRLASAAGLTMEELEDVARREAIRRLCEEGVVGEDYANRITSGELHQLIGE